MPRRATGRSRRSSTATGTSTIRPAIGTSARPIRTSQVYASNALEGALETFLKDSRAQDRQDACRSQDDRQPTRDQMLRGPLGDRPSRAHRAQSRRREVGPDEHRRPTARRSSRQVRRDRRRRLALRSEEPHGAIVGDLVVGLVPFMDTACAEGWSKALDEIAKVPFTTLIPGHGDPMSRADFLQWRTAYDNFVDCGHSTPARQGMRRTAGAATRRSSSTPRTRTMSRGAAGYYLTDAAALLAGGAAALLPAAQRFDLAQARGVARGLLGIMRGRSAQHLPFLVGELTHDARGDCRRSGCRRRNACPR